MTQDRDHYEAYYANKLWNLLPAVYRALDTDQFETFGPLREMVNRIGAQAAILRRSLDRAWQDQSIETCDDWVIPYIGDLLATNLVANLDPAGQRLDVAKTIYYRRRKGTLAVLEEIAANITGWDAKTVEFFRRLGRTRHGLDPAIGLASVNDLTIAQLQQAQGLVGPQTRTPMGGTARVSHALGASRAQTAFDEFFHTADFRNGVGQTGWQNIPHLGVFLWRLKSFLVGPVTGVPVANCPGWYTFDPAGRDIPLFALASRNQQYYSSGQWVSPVESQLPTPISQALYDTQGPPFPLYPESLAVFATPTPDSTADADDPSQLLVRPEWGRVQTGGSPPDTVWLQYCYGFSSTTGAGPYDRNAVRSQPATPTPLIDVPEDGAASTPTISFPTAGTVSINDSLTYNQPCDVSVAGSLTLQAANKQRPLLRFSRAAGVWTEWRITGQGDACLALDGLFVSGADIVLCGSFKSVIVTCCTFDPGSASQAAVEMEFSKGFSAGPFQLAADGQELAPCRLWIEGTVETLNLQRCITGPIRTRADGNVQTLTITDSIVQGIRTAGWGPIGANEVKDGARLERILNAAEDPISQYLEQQSAALKQLGGEYYGSPPLSSDGSDPELGPLLAALNALLADPNLYDPAAFARVPLSASTLYWQALAARVPAALPALNRSLLEDAYPQELADAALAIADGDVSLSRCTILGRLQVHRLQVSECILNDLAAVDDVQHGCVRFTAWAPGSVLPRQFESVQIDAGASLFTATDFGQPGYAQLLPTADFQLSATGRTQATTQPPTILSGAEDGSEMGAFCLEKNPIKEQALLIKYQEYMPAGLVPVLVFVT